MDTMDRTVPNNVSALLNILLDRRAIIAMGHVTVNKDGKVLIVQIIPLNVT